jgi:hypothetical protein
MKSSETRPPTVFDTEARRYEETHGDDPAKEFRASLNGEQLFVDECFDVLPLTDSELEDLCKIHGWRIL